MKAYRPFPNPTGEPEGQTAFMLREVVSNLSLNKRCFVILHELQFSGYCIDMLRQICDKRGLLNCFWRERHTFEVGCTPCRFLSIRDPKLVSVGWHKIKPCGFNGAVFVDHFAWYDKPWWSL